MRYVMTMLGALAALGTFPPAAHAEEPETVAVSRVTYYLELGDLAPAKAQALAALLKREFPDAEVQLLDGTLRIQSDASTFARIEKVLEAQREATLVVPTPTLTIEQHKPMVDPPAGGAEGKDAKPMHDRAALKEHLTELRRKADDLRQHLKAARAEGSEKVGPLEEQLGHVERAMVKVERALAGEGEAQAPKAPPAKDEHAEKIARLERKLVAAEKEGQKRLADELRSALKSLREARDQAQRRVVDGKGDAERRVLVLEERSPESLRRELIQVREVLEGVEQRRARPVAPLPPRRAPLAEGKEGARPKSPPAAEGPLAEVRRRLDHLRQAAEHLEAAGWLAHAAQIRGEIERERRQAEASLEKARGPERGEHAEHAALEREHAERAAQEARARADRMREEMQMRAEKTAQAMREQAERTREEIQKRTQAAVREMQQQAERKRRELDERAREGRGEQGRDAEKAAGPGAPHELGEALRSLRRDVDALRKELAALRELVQRKDR